MASKRISLDISPEMYDAIQAAALRTKSSKADVLRRAFTLYDAAMKGKVAIGFLPDDAADDDKIIDF